MIRRVATAAVLVPLSIVCILYLPSFLFLLLVDVILLLALLELSRMFAAHDIAVSRLTIPLALVLPWLWTYRPEWVPAHLMLATLAICCQSVVQIREMKMALPFVSGNLLVLLYLGAPLSLAALLQSNARRELLLVLLLTWVADSAAFLVGRTWGKHKVTIRISPEKSLEGYLASLILSPAAAILLGHFLFADWPLLSLLLIGVVLAAAGAGGDLFESMLKRAAGFKDSSNLIPGHGGVLDRLDSLLFVFPAYYLLTLLIT